MRSVRDVPYTWYLDDAENFVVCAVFSLAVHQEVIELEYANPKYAQGRALNPGAVSHDARGCNGIRYLPLVVRKLLFTLNEQPQVWDVSGQQIWNTATHSNWYYRVNALVKL